MTMDAPDLTEGLEPERKPRGRPRRADEEQTQRRRRQDMGPGRMLRLSVHGEKDPNYEYRWVNDDPGRLRQLTVEDDWDLVTDLEKDLRDSSVGTTPERVVDKGSGKKALLLRKRKEFYDQDKAREAQILDERETLMREGIAPGSSGLTTSENMYVPEGGIKIRTGR